MRPPLRLRPIFHGVWRFPGHMIATPNRDRPPGPGMLLHGAPGGLLEHRPDPLHITQSLSDLAVLLFIVLSSHGRAFRIAGQVAALRRRTSPATCCPTLLSNPPDQYQADNVATAASTDLLPRLEQFPRRLIFWGNRSKPVGSGSGRVGQNALC